MCLEPLLLAGYLFTLATDPHRTTNFNDPVVEVQTCERKLGGFVQGSMSGLYAGGLQYGMRYKKEELSITLTPKIGISYVDHPVYELPQRTQFSVGSLLLFGYEDMRIGIEYWHMSNAGMTYPNIGVDTLLILWSSQ